MKELKDTELEASIRRRNYLEETNINMKGVKNARRKRDDDKNTNR